MIDLRYDKRPLKQMIQREAKEEEGGYLLVGPGGVEFLEDIYAEIAWCYARRSERTVWKMTGIDSVGEVDFLTDRQFEMLQGLGDGLTNDQIANKYRIEVNTVKAHLQRLYRALAVPNRAAAGAVYGEWVAKCKARSGR